MRRPLTPFRIKPENWYIMARKKGKGGIIFLVIIVVAAVAVAAWFFLMPKEPPGIEVTTQEVSRRTIIQTVSVTGKIEPEQEVKISPETSGEIVYLGVDEGDTVSKNQLLIRIRPDLVESQLEQGKAASDAAKARINSAESDFAQAKQSFDRMLKLFNSQVISAEELEQAKNRMEQAESSLSVSREEFRRQEASLKQMRYTAQRTEIYAPAAGIVTALNVDVGETVVGTAQMAGTVMMRIADLGIINAVVEVDENDVVLITAGDTADVRIDALPDTTFRGVVHKIGNTAITSGLGTQSEVVNFQVVIRMLETHPQLRPGMSCSAEIRTETRSDVIAVPLQSVTLKRPSTMGKQMEGGDDEPEPAADNEDNRTIVFKVIENTAVATDVETGISDRGFIEIREGLQDDDVIVTGSFRAITRELTDGAMVRIDSGEARGRRPMFPQR